MNIWKQELNSLHARYEIISGTGEQRLENGLQAVQKIRQG